MKNSVTSKARIAVLVDTFRPVEQGIHSGLAKYQQDYSGWSIHFQQGSPEVLQEWLANWKGEGILGHIGSRKVLEAIERKGIPAVNMRGVPQGFPVPTVNTDNVAIARLAAKHLRELGLDHFAYCGFPGAYFSDVRAGAFVEDMCRAGFECEVFQPRQPIPSQADLGEPHGMLQMDELLCWLVKLPKPVGLMVSNDVRGHQVLNACRIAGIVVPDEISVIGVDNDPRLCELDEATLSSIPHNMPRIAHEAAMLLGNMMRGGAVPTGATVVPPLPVISRRSTDTFGAADEQVKRAMRFIADHSERDVSVEEVARNVGLSRRALERRFEQAVGRSPKQEIIRSRMNRVRALLAETDLPLHHIAGRMGFEHAEYLSHVFKRATGISPGAFRQRMSGMLARQKVAKQGGARLKSPQPERRGRAPNLVAA